MSVVPSPRPGYLVARELARGGMGVVELVVRREGAFARAYARKRLLPEHAEDPSIRAMFLEEARIAGLLRHANVVPVLDVGEDEAGPFLVMELVEGVPLPTLVRESSAQGTKLPVQVVADIGKQIADALRAAHELRGPDGRPLAVVHRDVTPSNVLVGFDGVARLTDFGIARALDRSEKTRLGVLKGKDGYLAPEQLAFEEPDARTDLYALGVVLYELLAGKRLRTGTRNEMYKQTREDPPPDVGEVRGDVPPEMTELLFDLLSRDRDARPADARTASARLAAILAELRAAEDPIDLGELVSSICAHDREEQRRIVADALERSRSDAGSGAGAGRGGTPTPVLARPARSRIRWGAWALGAGVVVVATAAAVLSAHVLSGKGRDAAPAQADRPAAQTAEPLPARPGGDEGADDSLPVDDAVETPAEPLPESAPEPPRPRSKRDRAAPEMATMDRRVPTWGWE